LYRLGGIKNVIAADDVRDLVIVEMKSQ